MSLSRRVRWSLDIGARAFGVLAACEARMRRGLTVLTYHRVLPEERCASYPFPALVISEAAFAAQVAWLAQRCEVLPLGQALPLAQSGAKPRRPLVSITFDDGYADNHDLAAPILEANGVRATFFVTTGFLEASRPLWFDRGAELLRAADAARAARAAARTSGFASAPSEDPPGALLGWLEALKRESAELRERFLSALESESGRAVPLTGYEPMTRAEVLALHRRGHELGSHSQTHPILPSLGDEELRAEIAGSRELLQQWSGAPLEGFCYPNGDCDERVLAAVRDAGYRYACTTRDGVAGAGDDPLALPRICVTHHAIAAANGRFHLTAFRAEVSRFHALWR
ncbi:MAG: polysaccharide deacetylase family protein [Planctomycetes bacterium]|nr:polysaccharide deacetylase family protein [Planctomycetota bacterium]